MAKAIHEDSVDKKRDEALRRMLNTPRTPHQPPVKSKPKTKKATAKRP